MCFFFIYVFIGFRERGRETPTRTIDRLSSPPPHHWGSSRQYRHVPWSEIEPVTSQCMGWYSTKLSHTGQGNSMLLDLVMCECIFSPGRSVLFALRWIRWLVVCLCCANTRCKGTDYGKDAVLSGGLCMQDCCPDRVVKIKWAQCSYSKCQVCLYMVYRGCKIKQ